MPEFHPRGKQESSQGAPSPPTAASTRKPGQPRGWRRWLFRLLAMTVVPAFFLVLLEGAFRLCGYGYPAGFFLSAEIRGQAAYSDNRDFGRRFSPGLARTQEPLSFPVSKTAGTYRIFILGESAAMGYPDASFHFGRILQAMLQERYPDTRFEVINTAFAAINSHVVLPIARECADHQPDLFIVYMGNNEVVGPFGPSGVLGPFSPNLTLIRASIGVKATRTGQFLTNLVRQVSGSGQTRRTWEGMPMFANSRVPADDPRLAAVYANFERNLQDICAAGRQAGARVLVSTVATNVADFAPFASVSAPDLASPQAETWKTLYAEGVGKESAGDLAAAVERYRRAAELDDKAADLHFRLGRCLAALKNHEEAQRHYLLARDLDALRFRADSRINEAIRTAAGNREADGVYLVDAEQTFARAVPSPREELFYEHVHLTFEGQYLLARTILEQLVPILPDSVRPRAEPSTPCLSLQDCKDRLPFTDWNRKKGVAIIAALSRKPPFTGQLDHQARTERLQRQLEELLRRLQAGGAQRCVVAYRRALERNPEDFLLHKDFGILLGETGQPEEAAKEMRQALSLAPHDANLRVRLAAILASQGKLDQAQACCAECLRLSPDEPVTLDYMGRLLLQAGKPREAATFITQALRLGPTVADFHAHLGDALAGQQEQEQALAAYHEALRLDPDCLDAHHRLGQLLNNTGRCQEALVHLSAAVRDNPRDPEIQACLGTTLANTGQVDDAIRHLEEALRLKPNWPPVVQALQELRLQKK